MFMFICYNDNNNNKIILRTKDYNFKPISLELTNKNRNIRALPNTRIGTFDMEVFIKGSSSIIYALGFY